LISADRDYIPTIKNLRHKIKIILIAIGESYPIELQNEAYMTLKFNKKNFHGFFQYNYPYFDVNNFTIDNCCELFSEADDRIHNQLRLSHMGKVYFFKKIDPEAFDYFNSKCEWESYTAFNDYVGPYAASDMEYIKRNFDEIQLAWKLGVKGYIDYPIKSLIVDK
jgi:hypothetical protein